jgi:hypothetical protein
MICPVCLDKIQSEKITLICFHYLCPSCYKKWFKISNKKTCPLCRRKVFENIEENILQNTDSYIINNEYYSRFTKYSPNTL